MATGYTLNPDGSYTFTLPDGRSVVAGGPEAKRKAAELDAAKPVIDDKGRADLDRLGGKAAGAITQMVNPPPPPSRSPAREEPWRIDYSRWHEGSLATPEQKAAAAQANQERLEAGRFAGEGEPVQAPPRPQVVVIPGGEQLAARTTQHGPGLTGEQQEQITELSVERRLAAQEAADAERTAQAGQTRAAALGHQNFVREDTRMRGAEAARLDAESKALAESKAADEAAGDYVVNPGRFWSSRTGWQKGIALIGSALGGALASRSRDGRNLFAERLDQLVAEDIETQREELAALERTARAKRDFVTATQAANDRARLSEGDIFAHRLRTLSAYAQRIEAETQDPLIAARARQADLDIQERLTERTIAEDQAVRGTETRQFQNVPTRVVGIGGQPSGEAEYSPEQLDKMALDYSMKIKDVNEAQASMESVTNMLGQYGTGDIPGVGLAAEWAGESPLKSRVFLSEEARLNQGTLQRMENAYLKATSGAAVTESEMARVVKGIRGARTPKELRAAIADMNKSLARVRQSIVVPQAVKDRYRQLGGYDPERDLAPSSLRRGAVGGQ